MGDLLPGTIQVGRGWRERGGIKVGVGWVGLMGWDALVQREVVEMVQYSDVWGSQRRNEKVDGRGKP